MIKIKAIIKENISSVIFLLFSFQVMNFCLIYFMKSGNFYISIGLFALLFMFYVFMKEEIIQESTRKIIDKLVIISLFIFISSLMGNGFVALVNSIESPNAPTIFKITYFINFALLLVFLGGLSKPETKEYLQKLRETNFTSKLKDDNGEKKPGDLQICIDSETKKPIIVKLKDRFLHFLVLGPTGSGKTSQTIIPAINQDMQNKENGIIVIEPKGDLAEKVYAMAKHYNREVVYFNPLSKNCPYFNPLHGKEDKIIENMVTTFKIFDEDSSGYFKDLNENVLRNALKVLKRSYGNNVTFIDLGRFLNNTSGVADKALKELSRLPFGTEEENKENEDLINYFKNVYFARTSRGEESKDFINSSALRTQVSKLISNKYLRRVLNPPDGENDIDFDKALAEGQVITCSMQVGDLGDVLSRYLGYFIILQLQSAVFRRPGNENTRRPNFLYIDEFQMFSNPSFSNMLTMGRSYRVASMLATQNRALIGMGNGQKGKDFLEIVGTNARNLIIYPGGNAQDALYYSKELGTKQEIKTKKTISRDTFNPLYGFDRISRPKESISVDKQDVERFSPAELIYEEFGTIFYKYIRDNSIQPAGKGKIEFIPYELNEKLDQMVLDYKEAYLETEDAPSTVNQLPPITTPEIKIIEEAAKEKPRKREIPESKNHIDLTKNKYLGKSVVPPNLFIDDLEDDNENELKIREQKKQQEIEEERFLFEEQKRKEQDDMMDEVVHLNYLMEEDEEDQEILRNHNDDDDDEISRW